MAPLPPRERVFRHLFVCVGLSLGAATTFLPSASGQLKPSVQLYGSYGVENKDNLYTTAGVDLFLESGEWLYIGALSYLRATLNSSSSAAVDTEYSGIPVSGIVSSSFFSTSNRYTLSNRLEYFHESGFNVALTANYAREAAEYPSTTTYTYTPRPAPVGRDTTFSYNYQTTNIYLMSGIEVSRFFNGEKIGAGALYITEFKDLQNVQPYVSYSSHPFRRLVLKGIAGAVIDGRFHPFAEAILSWRATPEFTLTGSLMYSRTTFMYNLFDRYLSYYREKNQVQAGLLGLYEAWHGTKLFASVKHDRNDRFPLWIGTAGVYLEP